MEKNISSTTIAIIALVLISGWSMMSRENKNIAWGQETNLEFSSNVSSQLVDSGTSASALDQSAEAQDSNGEMITISGTVVYDNYRQGLISIFWSKADNDSSKAGNFLGGEPVTLEQPGFFTIKVPQDSGNVYLMMNYYDQIMDASQIDGEAHIAAVLNYGPIKIGQDDIVLGDLQLEAPGKSVMESYKGRTVKISGKVMVNDYNKGVVFIIVKDEKSFKANTSKDIAFKILPGPGDYALEVPQGSGDLYIYALNIPTDDSKEARGNMPGTRTGYCAANPLNIKSADLANVDIVIK